MPLALFAIRLFLSFKRWGRVCALSCGSLGCGCPARMSRTLPECAEVLMNLYYSLVLLQRSVSTGGVENTLFVPSMYAIQLVTTTTVQDTKNVHDCHNIQTRHVSSTLERHTNTNLRCNCLSIHCGAHAWSGHEPLS